MLQYHNQTSPSHLQNTSRVSNVHLARPYDDAIKVQSTERGGTSVGELSLETSEGQSARNYCQQHYDDLPANLHYLRQPYYAMNHQSWWDLQTSGMHMSTSCDPPGLQGWPSAQGRPGQMPSSSNLDPFSMQSWLDAVILTPFASFAGTPGSQLVVAFQLHPAVTTLPALFYFIMFADQTSPATLVTPCNRNSRHEYALTARIPASTDSGAPPIVPLSMIAEDDSGKMLFHRRIGDCIVEDRATVPSQSATPAESRKRKLSDDTPGEGVISWKRSKIEAATEEAQVRAGGDELQLTTPILRHATPIHANHLEQAQLQSLNRGYFTPDSQFRSPFRPLQQPSQQDFTPLTRSFSYGASPAYTSLYPSPAATMSRCSSQRMMVNSSPIAATPLPVRAASMHPNQARDGPYPGPPLPQTTSNATYVAARPNLVIEGDLEAMLDDWSDEEVLAKRRLVVFERKQLGHSISITFKAVTPEERAPGSACVSCIWWEEKQGGYVTSVDTIALAESLCGYKFNVPVKNRIRRNLEGYKPTTVAKDKEESEEFFKLVMGFPAPKPRNIEKHIKVFPWKSLGRALKKIIGKYGSMSSSTTRSPAAEQGSGHGHGYGYVDGRCRESYLSTHQHQSPGSATSYEVSVAGSSAQAEAAAAAAAAAAAGASESPFFDATRPRPRPRPRPHSHSHSHPHPYHHHHPRPRPAHLDAGNPSSDRDQGPSAFQSADFATLPHDAGAGVLHHLHDYHHYARQHDESSAAAYYQWPAQAMQSSYDPALTATPTTDETHYNYLLGAVGPLPPQAQPGAPGMYSMAMAYYGSDEQAFQRPRSS